MNELNMIRALLDEAPPSAEVMAEGRRRVAASAAEPGRRAALRGVAGPVTQPTTGLRPARGVGFRHRSARGFRHRTARRVAVGATAAGAAAALAFVMLVPHGAPAARPSHGQAGELAGLPARGFLLTMAVKAAAAGGQSTGRWYCQQMESGQRMLVGADDTTLQAPWDQGPAASLAGYRYAIFGKYTVQSCFEPPTKGAPDGTVEGATQQLGAQPASPADTAAWRRAGSPTSWIAWYDRTVRITMAPGRRYLAGPRPLTANSGRDIALPTNPAQLKAFYLDHQALFHNGGTPNEIVSEDATGTMESGGPSTTPAVRAAAFRVLASLPGIRMKPNVQDPAGQSGTAVILGQTGPTLTLLIVDPATSAALCIEEVAKRSIAHVPTGTVIDYTLFTGSGWTNTPRSG
jgi:hypothetical protein